MDTELSDAADPADLFAASADYVESFGPAVFDHSRFDHAVFFGDDDETRLDRVYSILFPGSDRRDSYAGRARRKIRDAMHIATAIRYGANGFVTQDKNDLVSKSDAIAEAFNGFRILTPESALAFIERMKTRYETRTNT